MSRAEAIALASQMGAVVKTVKQFDALLESRNLQLAIVNATGAWVVIDSEQNELAMVV